jgi:nickel/cobalt transporter (NicO) family protein
MPDFGTLLAGGQGWFYLPIAFALGALHALEPGHAKSMMAGFIIATGGSAGQALLLGLSAALAHSLVVWALVLVALWLGTAVPEHWLPWLGLAAGLVALGVAGWLGLGLRRGGRSHDHGHDHGHDHHHDHANPHPPARGRATTAQVVAFGFSGGLMPCPAALAVLALCLSVGAVGLGLATVMAFSAGLAAVLVGVGLVAVVTLRAAAAPAVAAITARLPWISVVVIAASALWTIGHAVARIAA